MPEAVVEVAVMYHNGSSTAANDEYSSMYCAKQTLSNEN